MNEDIKPETKAETALEKDSNQPAPPSPSRPSQEKIKRKGRLQRIAEYTSTARSVAVNALLLIIVVAIVVAIFWELSRDMVFVEPLGVPGELAERGYTGEILARRLIDALEKIRVEANTRKDDINPDVSPDWSQPDIQIPGAAMSLRSIVRYVKNSVRGTGRHISGEITRDGDKLQLRLREKHSGAFEDVDVYSADDIDRLIHLAAREFMKRIDPYVLASFLKDHDAQRAMDVIRYCLANNSKQDDPWAYNLWGQILLVQKKYELALERYSMAIKADSGFFLAYSNSGVALTRLGRYEQAIEKHKMAVSLNPKDAHTYNEWGRTLVDMGDSKRAMDKFEKVVQLLPNSAVANNNFGNQLRNAKRYEEAANYLKRATELDSDYGPAYYNLGLLYKVQKDPAKTLACYDRALSAKLNEAQKRSVNKSRALLLERHQGENKLPSEGLCE